MTDNEKDLGSDALRSDPDNADQAREDLKEHAERGIAEAKKDGPDEPSNDHPEQDPAEGAREVIDRDLARDNEASGSAGSEAAEPSPGDRDREG